MSFTPRLEIYPKRIKHNTRAILDLCSPRGISVAGVTKVACAHPSVVHALVTAGVDLLADSRLENLRAIREMNVNTPLMLLRIPAQDRIREVVEFSDISLNSSVETVRLLSQVAHSLGKKHQVILMVDLGDLREGIWPDELDNVVDQVTSFSGVKLAGLGCNLACYGGVIPTTEKMGQLVELANTIRNRTGLELPIVSGGNSANLPLLLQNGMPAGITNLRIGEAIQLGRNVLDRSRWPGTRQDTYRVVAQVIELERKPSVPIGLRGQDAFGGTPDFIDRGWRKRAICNLGRQDIVVDNLEPEDPGIIVLGGSSDHLILDVEDAQNTLKVGSEVAFLPGYASLLAAATSPYVQKLGIEN